MNARQLQFAVTVFVALLAGPALAAEWGDLTGRFLYDGKAPEAAAIKTDPACAAFMVHDENLVVGKDGGLENIIVYVRTKKPAVNPEYEKTAKDEVVLDNKGCRFQPHCLVLRTSQTLKVTNSDMFSHNTKIDPLQNPASNVILPVGASADSKFAVEESLPVKVGCNIHPWMGGWILVRDDPYGAVTDKDGKFTIKDLPVGKELEFQLWQEKSGYLRDIQMKGVKADAKGRFKLAIKKGVNDLGDIKVGAKSFAK